MRTPRTAALTVAAATLLLGSTALAAVGTHQPPSTADQPTRPTTTVDAQLTAATAEAEPTEHLGVLVHGTDIDAAVAAVDEVGLVNQVRFDRIDVVWAFGTADQIAALADQPGVTHLEYDAPLAFHGDTSHLATRGLELREDGFEGCVTSPGNGEGHAHGLQKDDNPARGQHECETTTTTEQVGPFDGSGVSIAVIDSGVDGTHPMFTDGGTAASRVVVNKKFLPPCVVTFVGDSAADPLPCFGSTEDGDRERVIVDVPTNDSDTISAGGHGTHVATIAAGGDLTLDDPEDPRTITGAADGASVVALSVGENRTVGSAVAGQYWVLENYLDPCGDGSCPPIRVVNNSYGPLEPQPYDPKDATSKIQDELAEINFDGDLSVSMVWAAGNDGGDGSTFTTSGWGQSPTPGVIMVANYDDGNIGTRDGSLAASSARGDRNDRTTWPDISAPGTDITAGCRPWLTVCLSGEGDAGTISGTSMAAPHIAGIVAQLFEAKPDATAGEIEAAIENTAHQFDFGGLYEADVAERNAIHSTSFDKGHGLVDAVEAAKLLLGYREPDGLVTVDCSSRGDVLVEDGSGDATGPDTDLRAARIAEVADGFTITIEVEDLTGSYPEGSTGYRIHFGFTLGDGEDARPFFVSGSLSATDRQPVDPSNPQPPVGMDVEQFVFEWLNGNAYTALTDIPGSFDQDADTLTLTLTNTAILAANGNQERNTLGEPPIPSLEPGVELRALELTSQLQLSAVGTGALLEDDTAAAGCNYVLGSGQVNPPPADDASGDDGSGGEFEELTVSQGESASADGAAPATTTSEECDGPGDPECVTYLVHVLADGNLAFWVEADRPFDDFDILLYDLDGNEIAVGGLPLTPPFGLEGGSADVTTGDYYVVVQPFTAEKDLSTFTVTVDLA